MATRATISLEVAGAESSRRQIETVGDALREMDQASLRRISGEIGAVTEGFGGLASTVKTAAMGLVGIATIGAFAGWIKSAADAADSLGDLSKSTGVAVEDLAGLKLAAQQSGSELGGVAEVINKLSMNIAKDGDKFRALGIAAKDPLIAFQELSDVFSAIQDPQTRAALGAFALGDSWAKAAPLLAEGGERIGEMIAKGKQLSGMTAEMVEQSDRFNDSMAELSTTIDGFKTKIASDMLPSLNGAIGAIQTAYTESGKLQAAWVALGAVGAFFFTNEFSSAQVKIAALQDDVADWQASLALSENTPGFGAVGRWIWGESPENLKANIANAKKEIQALQDQINPPTPFVDTFGDRFQAAVEAYRVQNVLGAKQDEAEAKKREAAAEATAAAAKRELMEQAGLVSEISGLSRTFAAEWDALSTVYSKGKISVEQLTKAQASLLAKQPGIKAAADDELAYRKELAEAVEGYTTAYETAAEAKAKAFAGLQSQLVENELIGQGAIALAEHNAQQIEENALRAEQNALIAEGIDLTGQLADQYRDEAAALRGKAKAVREGAVKQASFDSSKKALDELNQFLDPSRAQDFGDALRDAFGNAGDSISKLTGSLDNFGRRQAEIAKHRKTADDEFRNGKMTEMKYIASVSQLNEMETKNRLAGYGDMAGAAAGFFGEQSKGYQTMMAVSKVFHAAELAMTMAELVPKGISAVLSQGSGDPYTAFGRMAAMAAVVTGLGVAIGGGGFSSGKPMSQARQESQGTGSVFGDAGAKSESIARSMERVEDNTYQGLAISMGMLGALTDIKNNIGAFSQLVVRNGDILGTSEKFAGLDGKSSGFFSRLGNSIFGGKKSLQDSGFTVDKATLATIAGGGLNAMSYADIKKDGGWFSSDKMIFQRESLGSDANRQITKVMLSLTDSVREASIALGLPTDAFTQKLDAFVVDIGKISFKDMKADEIEKTLQAVVSKLGDDMAQFAVGGLEQFQAVGEGYMETLVRIAQGYQSVDVVMQSMGMTFGAIGLDSIAARQRLLDLSGGMQKFVQNSEQFLRDFFSEQEQADALKARVQPILSQYGLKASGEDATRMFRDYLVALDPATDAGAKAYAVLSQIAPALKQIADAEQYIYDERKDLQQQLDEMTLTSAQLLDKQRAALHESNHPLFDQINALKDSKTALEAHAEALEAQAQAQRNSTQAAKDQAMSLLTGVDSAFTALQRVVGREKAALQERAASVQAVIAQHQALSSALRGAIDGMGIPDMGLGSREGARAQIQAALAIAKAGGMLPEADSLKKSLSVLTQDASSMFATQEDYLRDFFTTQNDIAALADLTDETLGVEERSLKLLEEEGKRLDSILTSAQQQIDVLKGIDTSVLSVADAIAALGLSIESAKGNAVVATASAVNAQYQSVLGRAPDAVGMQFWQDKAAQGVSKSDILSAIANSPEANLKNMYQATLGRQADAAGLQFWIDQVAKGVSYAEIQKALEQSAESKRIPGFANGGDFAGGLRIVGEAGPELEFTGASRIVSHQQLMQRLASPEQNNAALSAAVERLTREVEGLRAEARATATHAEKSVRILGRIEYHTETQAEILDRNTAGGGPMLVEIAPQ